MFIIGTGLLVMGLVVYGIKTAYTQGVEAGLSEAGLVCEKRVSALVQQHTKEVQAMQNEYTASLERVVRRMQALQRSIHELNEYYRTRIKELNDEAGTTLSLVKDKSTPEFDACVIPDDLLHGLNKFASSDSETSSEGSGDTTTSVLVDGPMRAPTAH